MVYKAFHWNNQITINERLNSYKFAICNDIQLFIFYYMKDDIKSDQIYILKY